ncbi:MAG: precorrin-6y C5,15-methyltransferase (decarboxylating) subunit CbiE [Desulfovibrionaceae bacterium]|nr:precorrin-6y C5,15-methyltransferase (decarboxylating) subunit CbiE [Desulfovibrionaceae bacterium]MBF0514006.1 precorrin-6y C5,15-methyltransferase (decarboxylating) subunit CbiE [Desulfovibrionaceae bacterium]
MPAVHVIGLPMDPADISLSAARRIMDACVLAGGRRLLGHFPDAPGRRIVVAAPLAERLAELKAAYANGDKAVVICGGDALHYGFGRMLLETLGPDALVFHPAPTAPQTLASRLKLPFENIPCVSLHGRDDFAPLFAALTTHGRAFVYTDRVNTPPAVAKALLARGARGARLWIAEDLGETGEKITGLSPDEAAGGTFSDLCVLLVELIEPPLARAGLGLEDELYRREAGPVTKWPVRAAAIAALRLSPDSTLWDLGAGCGAVGIEAASLLPRGRVVAVEKNPARAAMIAENAARLHVFCVETVLGEMPGCLENLPAPDRIFIGGGLGQGDAVLREAARRLTPGGRLVVSAVLLSTLESARRALAELGLTVAVDQIQLATGAPLAGDTQLKAHNPVFLIRADRPVE